jgi:Pyruvate/2-oxoacid:ferredoxin oxidoreductase delta subunit
MTAQAYRRLADHLDRLPGGFASTETGAELRLLATLFTPVEAELATYLTLTPEDAGAVAARAGLPLATIERQLAAMAQKGLILAMYRDGSTLYQAAPWVVGIYEFQVNNPDHAYLQALFEYRRALQGKPAQLNRQIRTIPVGKAIEANLEVLPYERVDELIGVQDRFAVAPCLCRRMAKLQGGGCDAPEEMCLVFGDWADYYVRIGAGRRLDRAAVMAIIARAGEANLVLQPSNSRDISFLCCCCADCCGVLRKLQLQPKPSEVVANAFIAEHDAAACLACGDCMERCPMGAFADQGGSIRFNADRCIGCGLCVKACPNEALHLVRKPGPERTLAHADINALWRAQSRL